MLLKYSTYGINIWIFFRFILFHDISQKGTLESTNLRLKGHVKEIDEALEYTMSKVGLPVGVT